MPYIPDHERRLVAAYPGARTAGELAYVLTQTTLDYLGDRPRYGDLALVLGVLDGVKLEIYRRLIAPYEDQKCRENGDVFP